MRNSTLTATDYKKNRLTSCLTTCHLTPSIIYDFPDSATSNKIIFELARKKCSACESWTPNSCSKVNSWEELGTERRHQVRRSRCENALIKAERETDQHCQSYQHQARSLVRIIFIIIITIKYLTLYITWIYPDNESWYMQCWHKVVLFKHTMNSTAHPYFRSNKLVNQ